MSRELSNIEITNGVERVSFVSPASLPGGYILTFPSSAGSSTQILKISSGVLAFSDKTFPDDKFEIYDGLSATSRMRFSADALSGNTRTFSPAITGNGILPLRDTTNRNTALGNLTYALSTSTDCTSLGDGNSENLTSGTLNTSIGSKALKLSNSTSTTSVGYNTLVNLLSGDGNTSVGATSMQSSVSSTNNISFGHGTMSLGNVSGIENISIGRNALASLTTGNRNIAVGHDTLRSCTTDSDNIAIGYRSLFSFNNNTSGSTNNIAVGTAMQSLVSGSNNISLNSNNWAQIITSGSNNILIGAQNSTTTLNNTISIGSDLTKCTIAGISSQTSSGGTDVYITGGLPVLGTITSTIRNKNTITPITSSVSSKLHDLNVVSFYYNDDELHRVQYGMIAEEVQTIYPENVVHDADGTTPYAIQYNQFIALLITELQKIKRTSDIVQNIANTL